MTFTEIGKRLGVTQQTVMRAYWNAVRKLQICPVRFAEFRKLVYARRAMIDHRESHKRIFQDEPEGLL